MRAFYIVVATCCFLSACIESEALSDQDQAEDSLLDSVIKEDEQSVQQTGDEPVVTNKTVVTENASISRTQDFKVVTQQETIESDAAKLAALKQNYTVIEPEELPQRRGDRLSTLQLTHCRKNIWWAQRNFVVSVVLVVAVDTAMIQMRHSVSF